MANGLNDARADGTLGELAEAQLLLTGCVADWAGGQLGSGAAPQMRGAVASCSGTLNAVDPSVGPRLLASLDVDRLAAVLVSEASQHDSSTPHSSRPKSVDPQYPSAEGGDPPSEAPVPEDSAAQGRTATPPAAGTRSAATFVAPTTGAVTSLVGDGRGHGGIDIANKLGTPIVAVADGEVISAGPAQGYGLWVRIRHDDGTVTIYGHNQGNRVSVGQQVRAGQQIAAVGNRGDSTGPHLHFEVEASSGQKVDPSAWLAARGASIADIRK